MEADWKKFREMVPRLRERYVTEQNTRIKAMLQDESKTETERFWDVHEFMKKQAKTLVRCLDGHSRSKMEMFMFDMYRVGMLRPDDLAVFSDDVRSQIPGPY